MRKTLVGMFAVIALLLVSPLICSAGLLDWNQMCKITTPTALQKVNSFPVQITTEFNTKAKPDTFRAWLNGHEMTDKFTDITSGNTASVDNYRMDSELEMQIADCWTGPTSLLQRSGATKKKLTLIPEPSLSRWKRWCLLTLLEP